MPTTILSTRAHFHVLAKPTGAICNLDCKYCFFLSKEMLYPGSRFRMADELLETYIRQLLESQPGPEVIVGWQGGEPTLDGPRLLRALDRVREAVQAAGPAGQVHDPDQRHALDDAWCAFFKAHKFLVGLSVDGPREMHDAYRVDKGGQGHVRRRDARLGVAATATASTSTSCARSTPRTPITPSRSIASSATS